MLRVVFSNQLEQLAAALAAALRRRPDPLAPATVVVPNALVGRWLTMHVARENGVAFAIDTPFLDAFLASVLPADVRARVLDRDRIHLRLVHALADTGALAPPVRAYLDAATGTDERALRRYQLADQLAALFVEYAVARPAMVRTWEGNAEPDSETEAWQRALWRRVFDGGALSLPAAFERVPPTELTAPPAVHVAGFDYVARAYYRIFERLGDATDLRLYGVNPCREYWEDIADEDERDAPALRLWGRPGRDHVQAITELTAGVFDTCYAEPTGATALAELQRDTLARAPARTAPAADLAPGVHVLACPSARREAEVIADEIWRLIEADPTLRFSDIAVLTTRAEAELYQTHLAAAFRAARDLPHAIADVPLRRTSRVVEAAELLLALPFGTFARGELLRLLVHPAVTARYPEADPEDWLRWADELAIVHGADRADHAGTYIAGDRFNWDQGLRRLELGAFMDGDDPVTVGGEPYLPHGVARDRLTGAARLSLLARSLIADARYLRDARLPLRAWGQLLAQLLGCYLGAPDHGDEADERALARCARACQELADADPDDEPVPYRIAYELATAAIGGLQGSRGEPLAGGVLIATAAPLRALPFRVVFVTGLGEGRFPAVDRESPIDLRRAARMRGDVTPRERDRYLFLQLAMAARERLYLSYVARDEQTGDRLEPSPVVAELRRALARGYTTAELERRPPLRRWEDAGCTAPEAERERRCHALRGSLVDAGAGPATIDALQGALPDAQWSAVRDALGLCPPPPRAAADAQTVAVSIYALRAFLECPLQASASLLLGLRRDEDDGVLDRVDEPFRTAPLHQAMLLRDVFLAVLAADACSGHSNARAAPPASVAELYDDRAVRLELSGAAPAGLFRAVDRELHLAILEQWRRNLWKAGIGPRRHRVVRFGRAEEASAVDELLPPLVFDDVGGRRVELYGRTEPVCFDPDALGSLTLLARERPYDSHPLRGFVDSAVLAAAGLVPEAPFHSTIVPGSDQLARRVYPAWTRDAAHEQVRAWLGELLAGVHAYLLPCEAVFEYVRHRGDPKKARPYAVVLDGLVRRERPTFSSVWGPVRDLRRFAAPPDVDDVIERRFGRYFEGVDG